MSDPGTTGASRISVERLDCQYLVAGRRGDMAGLRSRLDRVLHDRLPATCAEEFDRVLDSADPSVWLIRCLDVDIAVNLGALNDEALARVWAGRLVEAATRAMNSSDANMLRFPDRTAYLAQFVADLADDVAWGKWYYQPFASLSSLPTGIALREALVREPARAEQALLRIRARGGLERVLASLGDSDAIKVVRACCGAGMPHIPPSSGDRRQIVEALLAAWPFALPGGEAGQMASGRAALRLYLEARARGPVDGEALLEAIERLIGLAQIARAAGDSASLIARLSAGDLAGALVQVHHSGAQLSPEPLSYVIDVADGDSAWIAKLLRVICGQEVTAHLPAKMRGSVPAGGSRFGGGDDDQVPAAHSSATSWGGDDGRARGAHPGAAPGRAGPDTSEAGDPAERLLASAFGGVFLLLPPLLDLGLSELATLLPRPEAGGADREHIVRYLLALKCFGRTRAQEAAADAVLKLVVGSVEPPRPEALVDYSRSVTSEMSDACQARLATRLAYLRKIGGRCLTADLHPGGDLDRRVLLVRDIDYGTWVYATPVDRQDVDRKLVQGLELAQAATGSPPEMLVVGPGLGAWSGAAALGGLAERVIWHATSPPPGLDQLRPVPEDPSQAMLWAVEQDPVSEPLRAPLAQFLARAQSAAAELEYFSLLDLSPRLIAGQHFDLTCTLMASAVMRSFAHRLMGFHWSSADYLYRSFLAGTSLVRVEPSRIDVRLPRAPLHVVLDIAGIHGRTYCVPWLDDCQVTLWLAEE
jgi:hypothetical protein